ncbi:MAG: Holliday junction branch migration DNA helicase RuvB [Proteobacteria bacterium]|nr:Holliday junction branch migration DNA helicase RuvB [Pseudomonadota bacterium]
MSDGNRMVAAAEAVEDKDEDKLENGAEIGLRPQRLDDFIGQEQLCGNLSVFVAAAAKRGEAMDHVLFHGPPGLGKTTLAQIVAHELRVGFRATSGPVIAKAGDLAAILTNLQPREVLFIDEIHRLNPVVEEILYPAMEDFKVDFTVDSGMHAKTINIPLKPFTLIGATTRVGLVTGPLRSRFGIQHHLEFWSHEDLVACLRRTAGKLKIVVDEKVLEVLAGCSRGTPRVANRLLRRVRDYAQVHGGGVVTTGLSEKALKMEEIDDQGLDNLDRAYLRSLMTTYKGGPAGVEALAASLGEERDTLEDVVEPFLLQIGFVVRTRQGRMATQESYEHMKLEPPAEKSGRDELAAQQESLF